MKYTLSNVKVRYLL